MAAMASESKRIRDFGFGFGLGFVGMWNGIAEFFAEIKKEDERTKSVIFNFFCFFFFRQKRRSITLQHPCGSLDYRMEAGSEVFTLSFHFLSERFY
jgi:hypothetical protein